MERKNLALESLILLVHIIAYFSSQGVKMPLPEIFCWSRFGTEAGQPIEEILARKEQERLANGGTFFWGIGNALGPSIAELLRRTKEPEVLFSPIKSAARVKDIAPVAVAAWTSAETFDGNSFTMPDCSLVTSRYDPLSSRNAHYALVCFSDIPLAISRMGDKISPVWLRNLLTARPVGSSQVTAIVQRMVTDGFETPTYEVSMRMWLVYPYFLRLRNPLLISPVETTPNWSNDIHHVWDKRLSNKLESPNVSKMP